MGLITSTALALVDMDAMQAELLVPHAPVPVPLPFSPLVAFRCLEPPLACFKPWSVNREAISLISFFIFKLQSLRMLATSCDTELAMPPTPLLVVVGAATVDAVVELEPVVALGELAAAAALLLCPFSSVPLFCAFEAVK